MSTLAPCGVWCVLGRRGSHNSISTCLPRIAGISPSPGHSLEWLRPLEVVGTRFKHRRVGGLPADLGYDWLDEC